MNDNNFTITGDEARILMAGLVHSEALVPIGQTLKLYFRLSAISTVQPQIISNSSGEKPQL